nr:hypothetical protein [Tanacetum cinerariifolium]
GDTAAGSGCSAAGSISSAGGRYSGYSGPGEGGAPMTSCTYGSSGSIGIP